ncbi:MAG: MmgE/PrpD family protein, partial [Burkholderiaceae bacterium]|nr:MmgE/PrpD family protein [Burkholderiaceae bacterium]
MTMGPHYSAELARFASQLQFEDIPKDVISRAEDLLVDWFASTVGGKGSKPVEVITQFA